MIRNLLVIFIFFYSVNAFTQQVQNRKLADFNSVYFFGNMDVKLIKSDSNMVVLSATKVDLNGVTTSIEKGELLVRNTAIGKESNITVLLYYKDISAITAKAGADLLIKEELKQQKLGIRLSKGATMKAVLKVDSLVLVAHQGAELSIDGSATFVNASANAGGKIWGQKFETQSADCSSASGAEIFLIVRKELKANANTGGIVNYYGQAIIISQKAITGGKVVNLK